MTSETLRYLVQADYKELDALKKKTQELNSQIEKTEGPSAKQAAAFDNVSRKAGFLARIGDVCIANQRRLQAAARAAGIEVVYTVIESLTRDGRDRSLDHKISGLHFPRGGSGSRVIDAVGPVGDEIVITKTASGVFNSTNIEYVLRNLGIEFLVIYGIVTDQCVETAIRDAADRGFLVTQVEDCCAAETPERHAASIEAMRGHYCRTRSTDEMIAEITRLSATVQGR